MKNVVLFSGLGASQHIFDFLELGTVNKTYINWVVPHHGESLPQYARRLTAQIPYEKPILIGVSFGGMVATEMSKYIPTEKVIVISSAGLSGYQMYEEYVNRVMPNIQKAGADAPGPEVVAPVVYRAATDKSWRLRYQAGRAGGIVMFLRRILPTRVFNGIVRMATERKADRLKRYRAEA